MTTPASHHRHDHEATLDVSAALINTLERVESDTDQLPSTDAAIGFLAEHDLGHEADLRRQAARDGDAWLARFRDAREAVRELWDSNVEGRAPDPASLATLNTLLDRGPRVELRRTLAGVEVAHRHPEDDPTGEALARVATPLIEAIASGSTERLRICANDECRWVFEDVSRAGRRRWCDMATCGNQAKVRRFRAKRRGLGDVEDADSRA
jgi:predicted RNA-binding Zn ribbon-like protein